MTAMDEHDAKPIKILADQQGPAIARSKIAGWFGVTVHQVQIMAEQSGLKYVVVKDGCGKGHHYGLADVAAWFGERQGGPAKKRGKTVALGILHASTKGGINLWARRFYGVLSDCAAHAEKLRRKAHEKQLGDDYKALVFGRKL